MFFISDVSSKLGFIEIGNFWYKLKELLFEFELVFLFKFEFEFLLTQCLATPDPILTESSKKYH